MKCSCFSLLLKLSIVSLVVAEAQRSGQHVQECVPLLEEDPARFEKCKRTECFIILEEPPFVTMPLNQQEPFLCRTRNSRFDGAFFDIVKKIQSLNETSYCVWGGPKCTFKSMVEFVNYSSRAQGYRWIAGGLLFAIPNRIQVNVRPSAPLLEDVLLVIGPPKFKNSGLEAWNAISQPFTGNGWLVILLFFVLLLIIRLVMVGVFHGTAVEHNWGLMIERFWQIGTKPTGRSSDDDEEDWEFLNETWMGNSKLFIGICIILYEILVAVTVLETSSSSELVHIDQNKFALWENTTQEYFFQRMNRISTTANAEWTRNSSMSDVYTALYLKNNSVTYTLNYAILNRFEMTNRPDLCDRLRIYDAVSPRLAPSRKSPKVSGHWMYSSNIPLARRVQIDKEIVKNKVTMKKEDIVKKELPERCKSKVRRIDWLLITMFFGVAQGPFLLILLGAFTFLCLRRRKRRGWPKFNEELGPAFPVTGMDEDSISEITTTSYLKPNNPVSSSHDDNLSTSISTVHLRV